MDRLIRLSLVISLTTTTTASVPDFIVHPQSQIILSRGKLTLNCTVATDDEEENVFPRNISNIKWLLNGSRIGPLDEDEDEDAGQHVRDRLPLVNIHYPAPNQSVLTIERFNETSERGVYQCLARFETGGLEGETASFLSHPATVTSASMPKLRKLPDETLEVVENQTVIINFTIPDMHPAPVVSFVIDHPSTRIPQWSDKYYTSQQGSLQIAAVNQHDMGHYRAVFTNPVGGHERKARQRVRLKVMKTSKNPAWKKLRFLTQPSATLHARPGSNVTLECAAAGYPNPTVTWERVDAPLPSHEMVLTNLRLVDFQAEYAGTYICTASNGEDSIKSVRTLLLAEPPQFRNQSLEPPIVAYLGEPFSLSCPVVGHPKIQWFHNALLLPNEIDESVDVDASNHSHSGFYQCFASNEHGTGSRTFLVNAELRTTTSTPTTTTTTTTITPSTTTTQPTTTTTETTTTEATTTTAEPTTTVPSTTTTELTTTAETSTTTAGTTVVGEWWDEGDDVVTVDSTVSPVTDRMDSAASEVLVEHETTTPASIESITEEFSELPDWMPDSERPSESSIDYNLFDSTPTVPPPTDTAGSADYEDSKEVTRKPKKGKKYHTTTPFSATTTDDFGEDEENDAELMVPPGKPEIELMSETSVTLRWDVPPNDGLEIAFFRVQFRDVDGPAEWSSLPDSVPSETREWTVENLVAGSSYRFRITAVFENNVSKAGKKSRKFKIGPAAPVGERPTTTPVVNVLTDDVNWRSADEPLVSPTMATSFEGTAEPEPPIVERAQATSTGITIQWSPGSGVVKGHYVYYRESGSTKQFDRQRILDLSSNVYEISNLQPSSQYEIKMQSFNDAFSSDFSNLFEYSTLTASSDNPAEHREPNVTTVHAKAPSEMRSSIAPLDPVTEDDFRRRAGNNTQKSSETLYMVLGIVIGALVLLVIVFALICRFRQKQLKKKNADNFRGSRNRLRSSSREFVKDRSATLHTPAYRHPAFVASVNGAPFAKSQSDADLEAMRPLSSPRERDNESEPETESVERSVPRSRRVSPMDNQSLYQDPNADIYGPERTTDTFRRPSSAHPAMIAAWNDEASEYSMNTARSVDYGRRRNQKLRSQTTPSSAQINYYE